MLRFRDIFGRGNKNRKKKSSSVGLTRSVRLYPDERASDANVG